MRREQRDNAKAKSDHHGHANRSGDGPPHNVNVRRRRELGDDDRAQQAKAAPSTPPLNPSVVASTRNCRRITAGVAPRALRSPISRTRSVTETSMMFITPIPPTSKEMAAMPARRIVRASLTELAVVLERRLRGNRVVGILRIGDLVQRQKLVLASLYAAPSTPATVSASRSSTRTANR